MADPTDVFPPKLMPHIQSCYNDGLTWMNTFNQSMAQRNCCLRYYGMVCFQKFCKSLKDYLLAQELADDHDDDGSGLGYSGDDAWNRTYCDDLSIITNATIQANCSRFMPICHEEFNDTRWVFWMVVTIFLMTIVCGAMSCVACCFYDANAKRRKEEEERKKKEEERAEIEKRFARMKQSA